MQHVPKSNVMARMGHLPSLGKHHAFINFSMRNTPTVPSLQVLGANEDHYYSCVTTLIIKKEFCRKTPRNTLIIRKKNADDRDIIKC